MLQLKMRFKSTVVSISAIAIVAIAFGQAVLHAQVASKDKPNKAGTQKSADDSKADQDDADAVDTKTPRSRKKGKPAENVEEDKSPARPQYWATRTMEMRFGLTFEANDNSCTALHATVPFPMTWAEQEVELVGFEMPDFATYKMRPQKHGAGEIVIDMDRMGPNDVFDVVGTVRIKKSFVKPPEDVSILKIPDAPQRNRELSVYLGDSPYIETKTRQIRQIAKEIGDAGHENAWKHVEAIYTYVREKIKYQAGTIRTSTEALRDGTGDCEEMTSVFIAICRASNIPARCVWIPHHCYPEFYLEVDKDHGYWYPCQAAGDYQFGQMNDYRPILQKGDRFKTPESKKEVRYLAETFTCKFRSIGKTEPSIRQIQDLGPLTKELQGLKDGAEQSASTTPGNAATPPQNPEAKPSSETAATDAKKEDKDSTADNASLKDKTNP